jgi:aryl-alcohol dehydrogenase
MDITGAVVRSPASEFTIEPLVLAAPGLGEVLVQIAAVGLCHTSGRVVEVGPDVTKVAPGTRSRSRSPAAAHVRRASPACPPAAESYDSRRSLALDLGATHAIDPAAGPLAKQIRDKTVEPRHRAEAVTAVLVHH